MLQPVSYALPCPLIPYLGLPMERDQPHDQAFPHSAFLSRPKQTQGWRRARGPLITRLPRTTKRSVLQTQAAAQAAAAAHVMKAREAMAGSLSRAPASSATVPRPCTQYLSSNVRTALAPSSAALGLHPRPPFCCVPLPLQAAAFSCPRAACHLTRTPHEWVLKTAPPTGAQPAITSWAPSPRCSLSPAILRVAHDNSLPFFPARNDHALWRPQVCAITH